MSFPLNPISNQIYYANNKKYVYDSFLKSWILITTQSSLLNAADNNNHGLMKSADLIKLNRMLIPPPAITLKGQSCPVAYNQGIIDFTGDGIIKVESEITIRNIDERGEVIAVKQPFKVSESTSAINFNIDLQKLTTELQDRGLYHLTTKKGKQGKQGPPGYDGIDYVWTGPPGVKGEPGDFPPCAYDVVQEPLSVQPVYGLSKAIVEARTEVIDEKSKTYRISFGRQTISSAKPATALQIENRTSPWLVALVDESFTEAKSTMVCMVNNTTTTTVNKLVAMHIDWNLIEEAIAERHRQLIDNLRNGYENVVRHWVTKMSAKFDQQKSALCCALEKCRSIHKNALTRQHFESLAAAAAGSANVKLHEKGSSKAATISGSRMLASAGIAPDPCGGSNERFPLPSLNNSLAIQSLNSKEIEVNAANAINPLAVELDRGQWLLEIVDISYNVSGRYSVPLIISYQNGGPRTTKIINRGEYDSQLMAQSAYVGMNVVIDHDGGTVLFKINEPFNDGSGNVMIRATKQESMVCTVMDFKFDLNQEIVLAWNVTPVKVTWSGQQWMLWSSPTFNILNKLNNAVVAWPLVNGTPAIDEVINWRWQQDVDSSWLKALNEQMPWVKHVVMPLRTE